MRFLHYFFIIITHLDKIRHICYNNSAERSAGNGKIFLTVYSPAVMPVLLNTGSYEPSN